MLLKYPQHLNWSVLVSTGLDDPMRESAYGSLHEFLHGGVGGNPLLAEVGLGVEGEDPEVGTKDQAEETAEGDEVARELEPAASRGDDARDGDEEGNEDEDGVHDTSWSMLVCCPCESTPRWLPIAMFQRTCQGELPREQSLDGLNTFRRSVVHGVLVDEGVTEENGSGHDEEGVGGHEGHQHFVRHCGCCRSRAARGPENLLSPERLGCPSTGPEIVLLLMIPPLE